jgi:hypothetical protein
VELARVGIKGPVAGYDCAPCSIPSRPLASDIPAHTVELPLESGPGIWITAGDVVAFYVYGGDQIKPVDVRTVLPQVAQ